MLCVMYVCNELKIFWRSGSINSVPRGPGWSKGVEVSTYRSSIYGHIQPQSVQ